MLKYLSMNPRTLLRRLLLALCLVACVSWLALWCFREPLFGDAASADRHLIRDVHQQRQSQKQTTTAGSGQQIATPTMTRAEAGRYLEDSEEGKSLTAAITEARYSINQEQHPGVAPEVDSYEAFNPAKQLQLRFTSGGAEVRSGGDRKWQLGLRLKAYGYRDRLGAAPPIVSKKAKGNLIEYERANDFGTPNSDFRLMSDLSLNPQSAITSPQLVEWYVNKPEGLEQGFTLNAPPAKPAQQKESRRGPLRMALELSGDLHGELSRDGQSLSLKDRHGFQLSTYSQLKAWDATGRELKARMRLRGQEISLEVDDVGASYPLTIDPMLEPWQQQYQLRSTNAAAQDAFGNAVAISGNTAIVGAYNEGGNSAGVAYVFVRTGSTWTQQQRLRAEDFGRFPELFGVSVAIEGDTAIVGASYTTLDNEFGGVNQRQGTVFVYLRTGTTWMPQQMLLAADGKAGDELGSTIAINGNTIIAGAFIHSHVMFSWQGAAYVFTRTNGVWSQQQELLGNQLVGSNFGADVALSGETAMVRGTDNAGTADPVGKVYFFDRSAGLWTEKQEFTASDHVPGDTLTSLAISGDTALAGFSNSPYIQPPGDPTRQGAYVFQRTNGIWSLRPRLTVSEPQPLLGGTYVAIDHDTAILGFPNFNVFNGDVSQTKGSAFLFVRAGATWAEQTKLVASDARTGDNFGYPIAISGDTAVVGAVNAKVDGHIRQGSAYIFIKSPDTDGDGLRDDWEKYGVTIDGEFIDLPTMGADPMHKDIFIHIDWMQPDPSNTDFEYQPNPNSIRMVIDSFAVAPVANPDGKQGINLHVDCGPLSIMKYVTGASETWGALSRAGDVPFQAVVPDISGEPPNSWPAVDAIKLAHFTPAKRSAIFHYVLYGASYSEPQESLRQVGGISKGIGAAEFIMMFARFPRRKFPIREAGIFMHELGHNLGLHHGGNDEINRKPNYLSRMNYRFEVLGTLRPDARQRTLDYSRSALPTLDETNLDESVGIRDPMGHLTTWNQWTSADATGSNKCNDHPNTYFKLFYPTDALDWNCDGLQTLTPVDADLNGDARCVGVDGAGIMHATPAGDDVRLGPFITSGPNRRCETVGACDPNDATKCDKQITNFEAVGDEEPNLFKGFDDWANAPTGLVYDGGGRIGKIPGPTGSGTTETINSIQTGTGTGTSSKELSLDQLLEDLPPALLDEELFAPVDVVTVSPHSGPAALQVGFDGSASTAINGTIITWSWDFGDGTTGAGATVTHVYNTPGDYFATLTVEDSNGYVNLIPLLNRVVVTDIPTPTPTPTVTPTPTPTATPTPDPTPAGNFLSRKDGDWSDPCTWNAPNNNGSCGTAIPGSASNVEVIHNVTLSAFSGAQTLKLSGSISGSAPISVSGDAQILGGSVNVALTVAGNTSVIGGGGLNNTLQTKNITVAGAFAGTGLILVGGTAAGPAVFTNNGSVSIGGVGFVNTGGAFKYTFTGSGTWNLSQGLQLNGNNTLELIGTVTMNAGFLSIPPGGTLLISGALTFGGGQIANVGTIIISGSLDFNGTTINNAGLLDIGSSTLNFNGTDRFGTGAGGVVTGTGKLRFAPSDGGAIFGINGLIEPGVTIASGTIEYQSGLSTSLTGGISGPFVVDAGATFAMTASTLYLHNDVTINGAVTKAGLPADTASIFFNGPTFTNNGSVGNIDFLIFNVSDTPRSQFIMGTGSWAAGNINVGGYSPTSTVTLLNDVTFGINYLLVFRGATLNIGDHNLTLNGSTFLLTANGGRVAGTGLVKMQPGSGTATIGNTTNGTYIDPAVEIGAGTVKLSGAVFGGNLTVDPGATLSLLGSFGMRVFGDLTNNGTIKAFSDAPQVFFQGGTFANNGVVSGQLFLIFGDTDRQYVQKLAGAGSWTGTPFLFIDSHSITTLLSNVTYDGGNIYIDGRLNTDAFTLTLPCSVTWSGNGDAVGNVRRPNLAACPGAAIAYGNPFTTIQFNAGVPPAEITVNIGLATPARFLNAVKRTYLITPTGGNDYTGTLRLHYVDSELNGNIESTLQLWRNNGSNWIPQGVTNKNTTNNWVEFAGVTQFSPWTIGGPGAPTAAPAGIGGRITTADDAPLSGVVIELAGSRTLETLTDTLGRYQFENLEAGGFYTVTPSRADYSFSPSSRSFSLIANVTDAAFTASLLDASDNPLDTTEFFVRQHYLDFLGREPDAAGGVFWIHNIDACSANAICRAQKRIDTSASFFLSIEFQETGFLVERVYQSAFNRFPTLSEFIGDKQKISGGLIVGQGSWQMDLEVSKQQFAADFVARPDFIALYGGLSNQQYVDALNVNTGGSLSALERIALVAGLNAAGETRASALRKVAENAAFTQREFNRAFVLMQYFGYLRRNPNDAPDSDFSGYNFWLAKLNSFGGDFRNAEMVKAFISSSEYRGRFVVRRSQVSNETSDLK